jgi:hypothetical protein
MTKIEKITITFLVLLTILNIYILSVQSSRPQQSQLGEASNTNRTEKKD